MSATPAQATEVGTEAGSEALRREQLERMSLQVERMALQLDEIAAESRRSRERWDAIDELVRDLTPVVRLAMDGAATRLHDFEERGYGEALGAGARVAGDVMRSVDRDGIERIGATIVQLLKTIQNMR